MHIVYHFILETFYLVFVLLFCDVYLTFLKMLELFKINVLYLYKAVTPIYCPIVLGKQLQWYAIVSSLECSIK